MEVRYEVVSCCDHLQVIKLMDGARVSNWLVEIDNLDDLRELIRDEYISGTSEERRLRAEFDKWQSSQKRESFSAECSTSAQGFPVRVPDRLLNRRVRITIDDLGPSR